MAGFKDSNMRTSPVGQWFKAPYVTGDTGFSPDQGANIPWRRQLSQHTIAEPEDATGESVPRDLHDSTCRN